MEFKFCGIKLFDYKDNENFENSCSDYYEVTWVNESMKKYDFNSDDKDNYVFRLWIDGDVEVYENEILVETRLMWDLINEVLEE